MLDSESNLAIPKDYTFKDKLVISFYEALVTSVLLLGYNFTNDGQAVAFSLFVGIIIAHKISGGMFNPAVTIAVYVSSGKITTEILLFIMTIIG